MSYASFWTTIDKAQRDATKLRVQLEEMSREELLELYRDFTDLAHALREPPFEDHGTDYQEELTWYVVAQGRAAYHDIVAHPETFPTRQGSDGRGFMGIISRVFFEKFGEEVNEATGDEP